MFASIQRHTDALCRKLGRHYARLLNIPSKLLGDGVDVVTNKFYHELYVYNETV